MDEKDRKIVRQLQRDGRTSYEKLGKIVGFTSVGAKKRVEKLISKGTIKISALLNIQAVKLNAALIMLETESADAMRKILERFKDCPRIVQMFTSLGGYNLIALVIAEDQDTLQGISMEKCSLRTAEGVRRSEFCPIGEIEYSPYLPVRENLASRSRAVAPCTVDCRSCERYISLKCVRCPATHYYRGPL
ncbi:MAG: AsnC family transcriptional regulator [Aigarchaeota archaeon]|nr:AsnC family transcriptional regulator [Aigarchaeota archaeon]